MADIEPELVNFTTDHPKGEFVELDFLIISRKKKKKAVAREHLAATRPYIACVKNSF